MSTPLKKSDPGLKGPEAAVSLPEKLLAFLT
jgi:hypothetical protein